jgi:hypothetical protein
MVKTKNKFIHVNAGNNWVFRVNRQFNTVRLRGKDERRKGMAKNEKARRQNRYGAVLSRVESFLS